MITESNDAGSFRFLSSQMHEMVLIGLEIGNNVKCNLNMDGKNEQ